jgi:hypothetical protein
MQNYWIGEHVNHTVKLYGYMLCELHELRQTQSQFAMGNCAMAFESCMRPMVAQAGIGVKQSTACYSRD